jgi:hypothetical protein
LSHNLGQREYILKVSSYESSLLHLENLHLSLFIIQMSGQKQINGWDWKFIIIYLFNKNRKKNICNALPCSTSRSSRRPPLLLLIITVALSVCRSGDAYHPNTSPLPLSTPFHLWPSQQWRLFIPSAPLSATISRLLNFF